MKCCVPLTAFSVSTDKSHSGGAGGGVSGGGGVFSPSPGSGWSSADCSGTGYT